MSTPHGRHLNVYLPTPVFEFLEAKAVAQGVPIARIMRDILTASAPASVRKSLTAIAPRTRKHPVKNASADESAPQPKKKLTDAELIVIHREGVIEDRRKGFNASAIASRRRIPYRLVEAILRSR